MKVYHNALLLPQIMRVTSKKIRKLLENTYRKRLCGRFLFLSQKSKITALILNNARFKPKKQGVMRSFYMYITQIKPLKKMDYERLLKRPHQPQIMLVTSKKKTQNYSEPLSERGYEVVPIKNKKKFDV